MLGPLTRLSISNFMPLFRLNCALTNTIFTMTFSNFLKTFRCTSSCTLLPKHSAKQIFITNVCYLKKQVHERTMAGHSKWQNVKHVKAEKDRIKAMYCNKYAHLARLAVREKGPDPKVNDKLAAVIENAKKFNVPMATLEKAMKAGSSSKMKSGSIEISGPGGCFIIIEYESDNISVIRHDIKLVLRKYKLAITQGEGRWRAAFSRKGILKVVGTKTQEPLNSEQALDAAIEAGAEEVHLKVEDDSDKKYLEFNCDPEELHNVRKELENMSYTVEESYIGYIPNVNIQLSSSDADAVGSLLSELEDIEGVVRIYENVELSS